MRLYSYINNLSYYNVATATKSVINTLENHSWNLGGVLLKNAYADIKHVPSEIFSVGKNVVIASAFAVAGSLSDKNSEENYQEASRCAQEAIKNTTSMAGHVAKATLNATGAILSGATYGVLKLAELGVDKVIEYNTPELGFEQKITNHLADASFNNEFSDREKELIEILQDSDYENMASFVQSDLIEDYGFAKIDVLGSESIVDDVSAIAA